jgi:acetyltransferase-like isoleucine patch superfamily enzyme
MVYDERRMDSSKIHISSHQKKIASTGGLSLYKSLSVGEAGSWTSLIGYELYQHFCSDVSGVVGYGIRSMVLQLLLGASKRPVIGKGVLIRRPRQIYLEKKVFVDDFAALDVRGRGSIRVGAHAFIGRFSAVVAKEADVVIGDGVNIGTSCRIASQSKISIGTSTLIAAYCYIGPGNHQQGDGGQPLIEQGMEIKGGVTIGSNCWIGARATILDGVTIGDNAIVGAHSLVRESVPAGAVVAGTPARLIRMG